MKKLRLDLETLDVEAFETMPKEADEQGTVHGHDTRGCHTPDTVCASETVDCTWESCDYTCRCMTFADCIPPDWTA
jgi:hypothetical protein